MSVLKIYISLFYIYVFNLFLYLFVDHSVNFVYFFSVHFDSTNKRVSEQFLLKGRGWGFFRIRQDLGYAGIQLDAGNEIHATAEKR